MNIYRDKCFETVNIFQLLDEENNHQLEKWGVQEHTLFEWLAYITEELGELADAISENEYRGGSADKIQHEALQVATLALKVCEMVKRNSVVGER